MAQGELFPGCVSGEKDEKVRERRQRAVDRLAKQHQLLRADVHSWITAGGVQLSVIADLFNRNGVLPGTRVQLLHLLWEHGFELKLQQQGSWMSGCVASWMVYPAAKPRR